MIDLAHRENSTQLQFTGGEPTIRPDLVKIVKYAAKWFKEISIDTNGRRLQDKKFLEELVFAGVNSFEVSLLGITPSTHDALSGVSGSFSETIQALENISELKKELAIGLSVEFVLTKKNLNEIAELDSFLKRFSIDSISIIHVKPSGRAKDNFFELCPKYSESCREINKTNFTFEYKLFNIPACLLNAEKRKHLSLPPDVKLVFSKQQSTNFLEGVSRASVKKQECSGCVFFQRCPGVWHYYAKKYGLNEIKPCMKRAEE